MLLMLPQHCVSLNSWQFKGAEVGVAGTGNQMSWWHGPFLCVTVPSIVLIFRLTLSICLFKCLIKKKSSLVSPNIHISNFMEGPWLESFGSCSFTLGQISEFHEVKIEGLFLKGTLLCRKKSVTSSILWISDYLSAPLVDYMLKWRLGLINLYILRNSYRTSP